MLGASKNFRTHGDYEHCQSFFERFAAFRGAMLMAGVEVEERFLIKANEPWDMQAPLSALTEMPDCFPLRQ